MLEGCPDDGPSMAVDSRQRIHIVWPTVVAGADAAEQTIALFYAMSLDGEHFTTRERVPTEGLPHHPRIAVSAQGALTIAWDESANGSRRIAVAHGAVDAAGRPKLRREGLTTAAPAIYPALAVAGDAIVAAWTSGPSTSSSIQVARLGGSPKATDR
jgi:hypothetical protein